MDRKSEMLTIVQALSAEIRQLMKTQEEAPDPRIAASCQRLTEIAVDLFTLVDPGRRGGGEGANAEAAARGSGDPSAAAMTDDLPTVLQHMAPTRQQAVIRFCANRGAPDLATLLATSAQELSKAPGVGPSTIAEVQSILSERGASLRVDPVELTPHEDPRTRKVTDLWAAVHRDIFPGVKVTWEPRARYHLDERRAVDIAECAQGHGRDRIAFDAAMGQIEVAFRAYLGHLTERRNWPHEPTLAGFANAQKLPGRFTGAATPKLSGRAGRGEMSTGYDHLDGINFDDPDPLWRTV